MSGWQTVYLDTVNEANARALAAQLDSDLQPGQFSAGDENYCFLAYAPITTTPGYDDATWGYAVLARFNTDMTEGLSALIAVQSTPYVRTPTNPSNVWA